MKARRTWLAKDSFRPVRLPSLPEWVRARRGVVLAVAAAIVLALAATAIALIAGGDEEERAARPPEATGRAGEPTRGRSFLARLIPPRPERARGPRVPRSLRDLARLPLERKVAQLFLLGFEGQDLTIPIFRELRRLDLGGIVIVEQNYTDPQQLASLAGEATVIAQQEEHIPPFVLAPQEGGEFSAFPDLPPEGAPADFASPEEARQAVAQSARTLKALGVNGVLAPDIDVGSGEQDALGPRAYSDDPRAVAGFARATVGAYRDAGVLSAPKHFPGLGAASQPPEEGLPSVGLSIPELERRDLVPFRAAIAAGAPAVMLSPALYAFDDSVTPGTLSPRVATGLLRRRLRFRGVAITDDLASGAIASAAPVPDAAVDAIKAGADMLYISGPRSDQTAAYLAVLNAVRRREVSRRRIDEAFLRILSAKNSLRLIR